MMNLIRSLLTLCVFCVLGAFGFSSSSQAWEGNIEPDPRDAYLICQEGQNPRECYPNSLNQLLMKEGIVEQDKKQDFISAHPYDDVEESVNDLYGTLMKGYLPRVERAASQRWASCKHPGESQDLNERHNKELLLTQKPFSPGDKFLAIHVVRCLNSRVEEDLDDVRENLTGKKYVIHSQTVIEIIRKLFINPYLEQLKLEMEKEREEEALELENRKPIVQRTILQALLANPTWWEGATPAEFTDRCEKRAKIGFNEYQSKARSDRKIPTRLHPPAELRDQWAKEICDQTREIAKNWKSTLESLKDAVLFFLDFESQECRDKLGVGGLKTKWGCPAGPGYLLCQNRMIGCVKSSWKKAEERAMEKWVTLEFPSKNPILKPSAERYLIQNRDKFEKETLEGRGYQP